jgi:two-component system, LytTR family, response regulator
MKNFTNEKCQLVLIGGRIKVNPVYVVAMKAYTNYSRVYMCYGKEYLVATPLGCIAARIHSEMFVRTHRSYVINMQYLKNYDQEGHKTALMKNDLTVIISRRKRQNFIDKLKNLG